MAVYTHSVLDLESMVKRPSAQIFNIIYMDSVIPKNWLILKIDCNIYTTLKNIIH